MSVVCLAEAQQCNDSRVRGVNEAVMSHRSNDILNVIVMATTVHETPTMTDFRPAIDNWLVLLLFS